MANLIDVHMIRVFEGPRHDRLRTIWETIAEYASNKIRLRWFANDNGRLRHAECLNRIWEASRANPAERLVITEADWLPDLNFPDWLLQADLDDPEIAFSGVCYAKRSAGKREVINYLDIPGAWFLSFDRSRCPERLDFDSQVDPANALVGQLEDPYTAMLYVGADPYPLHVGLEYSFGTHLFWSRHLHDPPELRVSGYKVGELQTKHDNAVYSWIKQQPKDFQDLLRTRLKSDDWQSSCEYIDARSIFDGSPDRLASSLEEARRLSPSTSVQTALPQK